MIKLMKMLSLTITLGLVVSLGAPASVRATHDESAPIDYAQEGGDPNITATRVLGQVTQIDAQNKRIIVKTDAGSLVTVLLEEKTEYLRVPPGEKSLDKAVAITLAEIGVGDKVYARGHVSDDRKSVPAQKLIVMAKADIDKKHDQERAEWRRRGISGTITTLNPQSKEISIQARTREGLKTVVVAASDSTLFRRYAPDSVKFSDTKTSSFAELKTGDQLRALGDKSSDGTRFTAEQIVTGSFQTVGGTVKAVSPEANEIKIEVLGGKQQVTVVVNKDSLLRRIPPQVATFLVMRSQGSAGAAGPGGAPAPGAAPARPAGPPPGGPGGDRPQMQGGGDFQDMLERMPPLTLSDLKPGDVIAVSSTTGSDPSRLTAITLVSGVDVIIAALQSAGGARRGPALSTGLPAGVLDFGISQP
ncbi:MAG TPA: hypothetical protein VKM94_08935 [Blastocatellia bacterium]|nr:hypothetical protein [Blastocatellia bacterium]